MTREPHPDDKPLPSNQIEFEAAILDSVARGNTLVGDIVREQAAAAKITDRYGSGAGCFTDFEVPDSPRLLPAGTKNPLDSEIFMLRRRRKPDETGDWGNVAEAFVKEEACGGLLFNEKGKITFLECFCYTDSAWPIGCYELRLTGDFPDFTSSQEATP